MRVTSSQRGGLPQAVQLAEPEAAQGLGQEEKVKCAAPGDQIPGRKEAPLSTRDLSLRCGQESIKAPLCQHLKKGPPDNLAGELRGERMCVDSQWLNWTSGFAASLQHPREWSFLLPLCLGFSHIISINARSDLIPTLPPILYGNTDPKGFK